MKRRLNTTIWIASVLSALVSGLLIALAFLAGAHSGGIRPARIFTAWTPASQYLAPAILLAIAFALFLADKLKKTFMHPISTFVGYAEKFAGGDYAARLDIDSEDEFGAMANHFRSSSEKILRAVSNQQAQKNLQRSVTDFLKIVSQIARGDLTLRGKVTDDALGNVVDSVNYMLDNLVKVLERVRKAAIDVSSSANDILISSEEMSSGAVQQDQEITNTSSAVEELTVSMKQVSNNAEASAEAARRALDAAEQGNRAVRDTLEGMQRIRASVQATAKKIKSLGDRSLEISEIINLINAITEQTNLLALNAAIEDRKSVV